jgi:hypothetical protein
MSKKPCVLTDEQLASLASGLLETTSNIYSICSARFGVEIDDNVFDALKEKHDLFRCENCNRWFLASEEESSTSDWCLECMDGLD